MQRRPFCRPFVALLVQMVVSWMGSIHPHNPSSLLYLRTHPRKVNHHYHPPEDRAVYSGCTSPTSTFFRRVPPDSNPRNPPPLFPFFVDGWAQGNPHTPHPGRAPDSPLSDVVELRDLVAPSKPVVAMFPVGVGCRATVDGLDSEHGGIFGLPEDAGVFQIGTRLEGKEEERAGTKGRRAELCWGCHGCHGIVALSWGHLFWLGSPVTKRLVSVFKRLLDVL